jgi:hypothetical protein
VTKARQVGALKREKPILQGPKTLRLRKGHVVRRDPNQEREGRKKRETIFFRV